MSELIPDDVFDEDYLYFYETFLTDEVSDTDAALVARLSELTPGERVLDAPCGHGRIARRLAVTGARVTGVDRSELFIERARADAAEHAVEVDYRVGDVRELPVEDGGADVVVNWFSSFGYFDDAGNEAVLAEFARALRPGGRLVLETMSPAAVLRSIP
ncbi:MAG: class I SAM-dependent methyltransferase, partial [Acidimicrobiia bacterium]|nr:class I SAM-dependent methyltransferase [Acidimicrobiia bacterium]